MPKTRDAEAGGDDYGWLRLRIGARIEDKGYPVDATLSWRRDEQGFARGYLDPSFLPFGEAESPTADGERIFRWLFDDPSIAGAWMRATSIAPRCLVIFEVDPEASEIAAVPFEQLRSVADPRSPSMSTMVSANLATPMIRLLPSYRRPFLPIEESPLRMLVAIASPTDLFEYGLEPIAVADERSLIEELQRAVGRRSLKLTLLEQATLSQIERELEGKHGLMVICHGVFNQRSQEGALFLCDDDGAVAHTPSPLFAESIARCGSSLRLVHLSSCQSADRSGRSSLASLAPQLVAAGVPVVLGMQGLIPMTTARAFAGGFYRDILVSGNAARACAAGRCAVLTARLAGADLPVLYTSGQQTQLIAKPPGLRVGWREKAWGLAGTVIGKVVGGRRPVTQRQTAMAFGSALLTVLMLVGVAYVLNFLLPSAGDIENCIRGRVVLEAGVEGPLQGWAVEALSGDRMVVQTTTSSDGSYTICAPTRYLLRATPPASFELHDVTAALERKVDLREGGGAIDFPVSRERVSDLTEPALASIDDSADLGASKADPRAGDRSPQPQSVPPIPEAKAAEATVPTPAPPPSNPAPPAGAKSNPAAPVDPVAKSRSEPIRNPAPSADTLQAARSWCVSGVLVVESGPPVTPSGWTIVATGPVRKSAVVSSSGEYRICDLSAGEYSLAAQRPAELGEWLVQVRGPQPVTLAHDRSDLDFSVSASQPAPAPASAPSTPAPSKQPAQIAAAAPSTPATGPVDQDLGTLTAGTITEFPLEVNNLQCRGKQTISVESDSAWMRIVGPTILEGIAYRQSRTTDVRVDPRGLPAGEHRGHLFVRCLTCPRTCSENQRRIVVRFVAPG